MLAIRLRIHITLLLLLCMPLMAFSVTYNLGAMGNNLNSDLAVPMQQSKNVDAMFRHSAHRYSYTTNHRSASTKVTHWNPYGSSSKTAGVYSTGAFPAIAASGNYSAASQSHGSNPSFPKFNHAVKTTRRTASSVSQPFSNQTPNISTRMNVYIPGVSEEDGNGNYYDEEEEEWLPIPGGSTPSVGDKEYRNGKWWYWNGDDWVEMSEVMPVGDAPYFMLIMLLLCYCCFSKFRPRPTHISNTSDNRP